MSRIVSVLVGSFRFVVWTVGLVLVCVETTDAFAISEEPDGTVDDATPVDELDLSNDDDHEDDDREILVDAEPVASGGGGTTCSGKGLPTCGPTFTGPSCVYPCDSGSPCSFRYYCHADDRIAGMAVVRSRLFPLSPSATAATAAAALETWATQREADLGFPDGLTTTQLQFAAANNAKVTQGLLNLYRIRQLYKASTSLPTLPIIGEGALLTLEASPAGAVAIKGTIIDPRRPYAFSTTQASTTKAIASIKTHTSAKLGIPVAQLSVSAPVRVAVPRVEQIGWYGLAYRNGRLLARVTVSADPAPAILPLLRFDTGLLEDLGNTAPIVVRAQDPTAEPFVAPFTELDLDELADGSTLVGSLDDFSGEIQLADRSIVTVDVEGGTISALNAPATFSRFTSANMQFTASQPTNEFYAQRIHYLLRSAYATVNHVAIGKWDSAVQFYDPMSVSAYAAGAFAPRIVALFNHAPIDAAAAHLAFRFMDAATANAVELVFPELVQRPMPASVTEVVSTLQLANTMVDTEVVLHEFGHGVDTYLSPGNARDYAPACQVGCDAVCDEDTTDEAWPLDETVGQMVSLWMVRRLFPALPHEQCDLLARYTAGGTDNHSLVHSPSCMGPGDELNIFIRDDDPACTDFHVCDKPDRPETDSHFGWPNNCRTTDGYHAFSVLQAWWNTLNGLYCDPVPPYDCHDYAPEWPVGCGGAGSACVTPDEAAGLALVYALRTNPVSYVEFFDAMSRFVGCNYGEAAYDVFNQSLCDHSIRPCNAPLPLDCETCGNGIREGSENCDGLDLTVDEVGVVPQCSDFDGYIGGTLACTAMCELNFSDCEPGGVDETNGGGEAPPGEDSSSDTYEPSSGDGGQVGEDGCSCSTDREVWSAHGWWLSVLLLAMRRRRLAAAALSVGAFGCSPDSGAMTSESMATTESGTLGASSSGPDAVEGWPERWYGQYYESTDVDLGVESPSSPAFDFFFNVELELGAVRIGYFDSTGDDTGTVNFSPEVGTDGLSILPNEGKDYIDWPLAPTAHARAEIRPGADCSEMELEQVLQDGTTYVTTLSRGRICLVVPCDPDDGINCKVTVDLCVDDASPTTCEPA